MRVMAHVVAVAMLAAAGTAAAASGAYPAKPLRFIVTYPAGSGADIVARLIAQPLSDSLGQQVVVDNRAGAGGNIGTEIAAKAEPDGHTLVMCATALVLGPSLYRTLPYDPLRDLAPVTLAVSLPFLLVANPSVPAANVRDLIALAKAKPRELTYASIGAGTMQQLAAELFKSMAHVDILHVPYKGTGQYVPDLIAGRVAIMFSGMPPVLPHVKAGRLRALAVTTAKRSAALPDVPTVAEAALPGYDADVWFGVLVPAKTPAAIVKRLNAEIVSILKAPAVREQLVVQGAEPVGDAPDHFARVMRSDMRKYAAIIRAAHITLQ
jgi:tripartite-type tricarboxylate transporter receptor subunit TctC